MQDANIKYCVSKFSNNKNCPANYYISKKSFIHNIVYLSPGKIFLLICVGIGNADALVKKHSISVWYAYFIAKAGFFRIIGPAFINFGGNGGNYGGNGCDFGGNGCDFGGNGGDFGGDGGNFGGNGGDFGGNGGDFGGNGGDFGGNGGNFGGKNSSKSVFFHKF